MATKSALSSFTIQGILTAVAGAIGVPAATGEPISTKTAVIVVVGALWGLYGRWRKGDLHLFGAKAPPPAMGILALAVAGALALGTGCAAPQSSQGTAGQGGSTGATPMVVVNIGTGGGISTTNTSAPTAAPAATSTATADQKADATADVSAEVPLSGGGIPLLGGKKVAPKPVAPVPAPAPAPIPAPVEPVK